MWVHVQVERALEGSLSVAQTYYKNGADKTLYFAKQISKAIQRQGLLADKSGDNFSEFLRIQQITFGLDNILLIPFAQGEIIQGVPYAGFKSPGPPDKESLDKVKQGRESTRILSVDSGEVIEVMVPVGGRDQALNEKAVLVVQRYIPKSLIEQMAQISQSLEKHQQMMLYKYPFKSVILMSLMMVTLLIVFSATWFGFYLAKGITIPLKHLADGTKEVAAGNLQYRIETASEDEMGTLVDSFNKMIEDLKRKGEEVADAQQSLNNSNLELEQRRRYMEIVLRNVGAGVLSYDRQGRIQTINRSLENLFSIRASNVMGKTYEEVFGAENMRPIRLFIEEVNQRQLKGMERQAKISLQQEPKNIHIRARALEDESGAWMGVVMVFEDHTELFQAQRVAAWREVARRIAHEIKNPLTPIQLSAQRLQKRYADKLLQDGKVFEECTNTIISQVEEMKNLVNEFSQFARMPAAKPIPSDLNAIVREVLSLYKEAHRSIEFTGIEDPVLPDLLLDPDQIRRVLTNLLDNAVDAVTDKGHIELMTQYDSFYRMAVLQVTDNGCGIPQNIRPRIFEPYLSTKKRGTGLGLAIVKTIISDHNAYIRVRDHAPHGTRFVLEFPVPIS